MTSRAAGPRSREPALCPCQPVPDAVADPARLGPRILRVARSADRRRARSIRISRTQVWEALAITKERDFTYPASSGTDLYRRSLYTFWRRTVSPANMFDASNRQTCRVRHSTTSTPLHALTIAQRPDLGGSRPGTRGAKHEGQRRLWTNGSFSRFAKSSHAADARTR